jgi:hypothetical protein
MADAQTPLTETDPRFPSGPWTGYFLMPHTGKKKHPTELKLSFLHGVMAGTGRDFVGPFTVRGKYDLSDGKCYWTKRYVRKHDVFYSGFNEGRGIWGTWEILESYGKTTGGFHIWPEAIGDPSQDTLTEEAELPAPIKEAQVGEPLEVR